MKGCQLATEPTYTFYTYSIAGTEREPRWDNDGINDVFFLNIDDARRAVVEIHEEISNDAYMGPMTIHLEKIETVPITIHSLLSLLNGDLASLIESYEIIESFFAGQGEMTAQVE